MKISCNFNFYIIGYPFGSGSLLRSSATQKPIPAQAIPMIPKVTESLGDCDFGGSGTIVALGSLLEFELFDLVVVVVTFFATVFFGVGLLVGASLGVAFLTTDFGVVVLPVEIILPVCFCIFSVDSENLDDTFFTIDFVVGILSFFGVLVPDRYGPT